MQSLSARKQIALAAALVGFLALTGQGNAADLSLPVTGNLMGSVVNATGTPQMGASVLLFNKYQRLVARALTMEDGRFAFADLPGDNYSVRVTLASFLPAFRDRIAVKAGLNSILQIHLATLFSSVELNYSLPTGAMSDDWKWVLRSSPATRPITRFLPGELSTASTGRDLEAGLETNSSLHPKVFSETHAMLAVSGGDGGGLIDLDSAQTDMGTQFALSTRLLGNNQLQIAGTYGQNSELSPAAFGLSAIYSRDPNGTFGNLPEITMTVSQSSRFGGQVPGNGIGVGNSMAGSSPVLHSMSFTMYEVTDPLDSVHVEYGMTGESVDYFQQHASRISPFARITVNLGKMGQVMAAYSDGGRPDALTAHQPMRTVDADGPSPDLSSAVDALARLPQISSRDNQLVLQRTQNYEVGYSKLVDSTTYSISAFDENVRNGRMDLAGDLSPLNSGDLLFDETSKISTFNIGNYARTGFLASADQRLNDSLDVAVAYGRMGGFTPGDTGLGISGGGQQFFLREQNHNAATVNLSAKAPIAGTRIIASYGWADSRSFVPNHIFTTQNMTLSPGLNFSIRQPLPSFFGLPGRLALTADLRNLLAQGYVPFDSTGHRLLIVQSPRSVRGGLSFTF
ncbi:MAG TPA: carboxypeptidase-like regulatory domain-containing protein [Bryobacteraceae bacterium]